MAGPLRPNPPPSSLMAVGTLENKIRFQKSFFFLNGPDFYPTPLLMARPLREEFFLRLPLATFIFESALFSIRARHAIIMLIERSDVKQINYFFLRT